MGASQDGGNSGSGSGNQQKPGMNGAGMQFMHPGTGAYGSNGAPTAASNSGNWGTGEYNAGGGQITPGGNQVAYSEFNNPLYNEQTQKGKNAAYNNQSAANAAHPNTTTGTGSQSWTANPDGSFSESNTLSQPLAGAQNSLSNAAQTNAQNGIGNGDQARDQAVNAAYNQSTSRLDPQFAQAQEQMNAQLAAQGLDPTSQAAQTQQQNFGRQQNDAYQSAMNSAIAGGTAAQQATFGENLQAYNAPLTQLESMNGLYSPGNTSGLQALQSGQQYTAAQNAAAAQTVGAVAGTVASVASDERVKQNIHRLPVDAVPGVPLSTFEYKTKPGEPQVGVIAQDLEGVAPQHVAQGPDGIKRVSQAFAPLPLQAAQAAALRKLGKK